MPLERRVSVSTPHALLGSATRVVLACATLVVLTVLPACKSLPGSSAPDPSRGKFRQTARQVSVSDPVGKGGSQALVLLAQQRLRTGNVKEAAELARKAVRQQPQSPEAHAVLGLVLEQQGDIAAAGASYRKATELAPSRGEFLNNYGAWLCRQGREEESLQWFDRAAAAPGYATPAAARGNAGACALAAGQTVRAERDLRAAIQDDPDNAVALGALARMAFDARRMMEARAFSERRLASAPPTPEALQLASQIEQELGDSDAARRYVEQMQKRFPGVQPPRKREPGSR